MLPTPNDIDITVIDLNGKRHLISAPTDMGLNLMEAIRANEIPIKAVCGGMAMCASCHVIIKSKHPLPKMSPNEEAMLDEAFVLETPISRLSCQIPLTKELNGLAVKLGKLTAIE
jgi:2Fe-2S ferredoxin